MNFLADNPQHPSSGSYISVSLLSQALNILIHIFLGPQLALVGQPAVGRLRYSLFGTYNAILSIIFLRRPKQQEMTINTVQEHQHASKASKPKNSQMLLGLMLLFSSVFLRVGHPGRAAPPIDPGRILWSPDRIARRGLAKSAGFDLYFWHIMGAVLVTDCIYEWSLPLQVLVIRMDTDFFTALAHGLQDYSTYLVRAAKLLLISEAASRACQCIGQLGYSLGVGFYPQALKAMNLWWMNFWVEVIRKTMWIYSYTYCLTYSIRIAHYLISFGRFLAVAFDGRYFHLAVKWPYAQLLLPYLAAVVIRILIAYFPESLDWSQRFDDLLMSHVAALEFNLFDANWIGYVDSFLISHIAAFDCFAYEKLKALVFSSVIYILLTLIAKLAESIAQIFLGPEIASAANLGVTQLALFLFLAYDGQVDRA
ncbi:unnamed protein product, partial [Mesorhabditis spiculigera]